MKHIIDIETWERRDNYNFFRNFHNSWISITSEVDCTEAFPAAKAAKRSFFLYYLYAVLRAANEVKEFRFRTDKNGQVVYHDQVDIISPIAVPGKTFYTVRIPYHADFERFYAEAYHIVHNIPEELASRLLSLVDKSFPSTLAFENGISNNISLLKSFDSKNTS